MSEKKPYTIRVQTRYAKGTATVYAKSDEEADELCDLLDFDDIDWDWDADFDIVSVEEAEPGDRS